MDGIPDQGRIHVDNLPRRRSDAAPSIDAIFERSRMRVVDDDHTVEPHGRRMSMPVQNGSTRRHSEVSVGRRPSITHPNQVLPMNESSRVLPEPRMPRERNEFYNPSRSVRSATTDRSRGNEYDDSGDERYVVPALPMPMAILCCILNFLLPGFGSMLAGLSVLCCARTEGMTCKDKCSSCCTVCGIGILQLLLVACFLIGWIWSCIWGITFIGMSASFYEEEADEYEDYDEAPVRRQHHPTGHTPLPVPEVVVDQPYPGVHYADRAAARSRDRRQRNRRTLSRISLTPSNFIYPMRAPSSIVYNSPPPPYRERATPPPSYSRHSQQRGDRRVESRVERGGFREEGNTSNVRPTFRPQQLTAETIYEEHARR